MNDLADVKVDDTLVQVGLLCGTRLIKVGRVTRTQFLTIDGKRYSKINGREICGNPRYTTNCRRGTDAEMDEIRKNEYFNTLKTIIKNQAFDDYTLEELKELYKIVKNHRLKRKELLR